MTTHPPASSRTLVLVRHSKASHHAPTDLERPLTSRGQEMADALARALRGRLPGVDLLLVSPAARARQTARPLKNRLAPTEIRVEPEIYHEGPAGIMGLLTAVEAEVRTVVVVGHEPTISVLAHNLHDVSDDLASEVSFGVPTATALLLDVPVEWAALGASSAHLREMLTAPR